MQPVIRYRSLTMDDVNTAADIISQAYFNDPLCAFCFPNQQTRFRAVFKLFRVLGELNIRSNRGYGVGRPLQGIAFWKGPTQESMSISIKSIGRFIPLLFTSYPLGSYRAKEIVNQIDLSHDKYTDGPHY